MEKICTKCKINKNIEEYSSQKQGKFGKRSKCKRCCSQDTKEWQKRNPEKTKQNERIQNAKKDYTKENKRRYEKNPNFYKEWYWSNLESRLKKISKRKEWLLKNPLKTAEYAKTQRIKNPIKTRARNKVKCAVKKGILIKPKQCEKCNLNKNKIEGHHEDYSNSLSVIWLCAECHKQLHVKT